MPGVALRKKVKSELNRFSDGKAETSEMTPIVEL
jgi:hypothetical protein